MQETAYAALAEIPRRLELVHNLSDCVRETIELYRAMDAVLVALFGALTKIIDHLENSKKSLSKWAVIRISSWTISNRPPTQSFSRQLTDRHTQGGHFH